MKNIKWFTENYLENEKQCEFLLEKAEEKYSFTKEQLYEGCFELRKNRFEKDLLETHLDLLGKMSVLGIKANIAGVKIKEALLESATIFDLIWKTSNSFRNSYGKYPDTVKMNLIHKRTIEDSANMVKGFVIPSGDGMKIMGMKLEYDTAIKENVVVCS